MNYKYLILALSLMGSPVAVMNANNQASVEQISMDDLAVSISTGVTSGFCYAVAFPNAIAFLVTKLCFMGYKRKIFNDFYQGKRGKALDTVDDFVTLTTFLAVLGTK